MLISYFFVLFLHKTRFSKFKKSKKYFQGTLSKSTGSVSKWGLLRMNGTTKVPYYLKTGEWTRQKLLIAFPWKLTGIGMTKIAPSTGDPCAKRKTVSFCVQKKTCWYIFGTVIFGYALKLNRNDSIYLTSLIFTQIRESEPSSSKLPVGVLSIDLLK